MIRAFPMLDGLLLAAAVFAVSGCLVFLMGGEAAKPWLYATVLAGLVLVPVAYLGRQRGRNNLDHVFIGPSLRISALFMLVGAGGLWLFQAAHQPRPDDEFTKLTTEGKEKPQYEGQELSEACQRRLENAKKMLSNLEKIADNPPNGLADSAEFRGQFNLVDGSDWQLAACGGPKIMEYVQRRNSLIEKLRAYYDRPTKEPLANIADAITKNPAKTSEPEKPAYTVEKEQPPVQGATPKVYVVLPDPIQPPPLARATPGNDPNGTGTPPPTHRRVEYRSDFLPQLLEMLLDGFGWGTTKIRVEEVEGAIAEVKKQNSGQMLDDLFDKKSLIKAERYVLIQKLVELGFLEEAAGSEWSGAMKIYMSGRPHTALCLAIKSDKEFLGGTDLNELLKWRGGRTTRDRIEIDAEVRRCLVEGLSRDQRTRVLGRYQELINASGG